MLIKPNLLCLSLVDFENCHILLDSHWLAGFAVDIAFVMGLFFFLLQYWGLNSEPSP
jgi:hypothetical protein